MRINFMERQTVLRVARPTDNLEASTQMYMDGLGFELVDRFDNHNGYNVRMLGCKGGSYHLEFTQEIGHSVGTAPTHDNLLVFYYPNYEDWVAVCKKMDSSGFSCVQPYNPYWLDRGKTYEDSDGYRVVIQNEAWP